MTIKITIQTVSFCLSKKKGIMHIAYMACVDEYVQYLG